MSEQQQHQDPADAEALVVEAADAPAASVSAAIPAAASPRKDSVKHRARPALDLKTVLPNFSRMGDSPVGTTTAQGMVAPASAEAPAASPGGADKTRNADFSDTQTYVFGIEKRGRTLYQRRRRQLVVDFVAGVIHEMTPAGDEHKRAYRIQTVRGLERVGSSSVSMHLMTEEAPSKLFKFESRAQAEMFMELVLSIKEGPMQHESQNGLPGQSAAVFLPSPLALNDEDESDLEIEDFGIGDCTVVVEIPAEDGELDDIERELRVASMNNDAQIFAASPRMRKLNFVPLRSPDPFHEDGGTHSLPASPRKFSGEARRDFPGKMSKGRESSSVTGPSISPGAGLGPRGLSHLHSNVHLPHQHHRAIPIPHSHRPVDVNVALYTWNMGGAKPEQPSAWIQAPAARDRAEGNMNGDDDIVVVAVQECTFDPSSRKYLVQYWQSMLASAMAMRKTKYVCLAHVDHWNRVLSVYVRESLISRIGNVKSDTTNVGVAGVGGNKGAIGLRFTLFDTVFCFINSHLAAHQNETLRRNQDYEEIVRGLKKIADPGGPDIMTSHCHHLFWMGDLNYRIDLARETVLECVASEQWTVLGKRDQLFEQRALNRAFYGFKEGKLCFPPTYKYAPGVWDAETQRRVYSSEKGRAPAWCDRVLVRSLRGSSSTILQYSDISHKQIVTSDHSPVFARVQVDLIHTTGLKGRDTLLRLSRDTEVLFLRFENLRISGLASSLLEQAGASNGGWTCSLTSSVLHRSPHKMRAKKEGAEPHWTLHDSEAVRLMENKLELLARKYVTLTFKFTGKVSEFFVSCVLGLNASVDLLVAESDSLGSWFKEEGTNPATSAAPAQDATKRKATTWAPGKRSAEFHETLLRNGLPCGVLDGSYALERLDMDTTKELDTPPTSPFDKISNTGTDTVSFLSSSMRETTGKRPFKNMVSKAANLQNHDRTFLREKSHDARLKGDKTPSSTNS
ncbi:Phosphatidylinositol 3,4,5-trisphosphate 5-phosphatase 1 [Porphyridium purpureum]|uniref:Phosphatidylinositol 3,4,5-trisphosphate 5-phosphatase 1 n=1 Tax=Porphyridium purpureum TaxID=35688 RepID=A0A5J4Z4C9_PORPP|nr:Phosphatidylinositol 3,4,5-trisphosphate 5-phosphatase 1 [Porphyridium purpureum]|eukprot:POR2746..scf295_1